MFIEHLMFWLGTTLGRFSPTLRRKWWQWFPESIAHSKQRALSRGDVICGLCSGEGTDIGWPNPDSGTCFRCGGYGTIPRGCINPPVFCLADLPFALGPQCPSYLDMSRFPRKIQ